MTLSAAHEPGPMKQLGGVTHGPPHGTQSFGPAQRPPLHVEPWGAVKYVHVVPLHMPGTR